MPKLNVKNIFPSSYKQHVTTHNKHNWMLEQSSEATPHNRIPSQELSGSKSNATAVFGCHPSNITQVFVCYPGRQMLPKSLDASWVV